VSKETPGGAEVGTYDAQDRLLSYGPFNFTYTTNGELATKTNVTNGAVTPFIDELNNLTTYEVVIRTAAAGQDVGNGAQTYSPEGGSQIVYDWDRLQKFSRLLCEWRANASMPLPPFLGLDIVLAHELGHAYFWAFQSTLPSGMTTDDMAVIFENLARGDGPGF
jgi:hypothetical protein